MTIPSSAWRTGGLLFLAAKCALAGGSPWFGQLGLDPAWLYQTASDDASGAPPVSGLQVRSSSDLSFRSPLAANWNQTRIVQTFSGSAHADSLRWSNWARTSISRSHASFATTEFGFGGASSGIGWIAGSRFASDHCLVGLGFEAGSDREGISGRIALGQGRAWLSADLARISRRSDLEVSVAQGDLAMEWNDVADSLHFALNLPLGSSQWTARTWRSESGSPGGQDLVDTGSASGWSLGVAVPTDFGKLELDFQRDRSELRTLGSRGGRIFHDQDWRSVRVGIDASWSDSLWSIRGSTRQFRLELPFGGLTRPFVHWNMIPDDAFGRIAGVLEDRTEYLEGSFKIESWNFSAGRRWAWKSVEVSPGIGASWTGFDATLDRSTLEVRGLLPTIEESTPCDGEGWIAMLDAELMLEWKTSGLGTLRAGGVWRQPFAGRWKSRLAGEVPPSTSNPGNSASPEHPVDPLGFHSWSLDWMLAL